jgi:acyl-CoA dehydrogenase
MNLDFTSEQEMLKDAASKFFSNECPYDRVKELEDSEAGYSAELWQKMAELGWQGLIFPEEYGGFGAAFMDLILLSQEMGKAVCPSPFFSTVIQCGLTLLEGGTEDQKREFLARIAGGDLIMALAQYEEGGSYFSSGIRMRAEVKGSHYLLNGTKLFVLDANICEKLIVVARTDGGGTTLFMVEANDPGVVITKMPTIGKDNLCEVTFKDVTVNGNRVIGAVGKGWEILEKVEAKAAVVKAAEMVGGCRACIDLTAEYAKQREQYGMPIGGFQIIQHYLANMLIRYDVSANYLYQVASMVEEGLDFVTEASALKASVNESYKFVSERAVQIHGAIGTSREADIALFYRKAKSYEYACGDSDYHYEKVIQNLLAR